MTIYGIITWLTWNETLILRRVGVLVGVDEGSMEVMRRVGQAVGLDVGQSVEGLYVGVFDASDELTIITRNKLNQI